MSLSDYAKNIYPLVLESKPTTGGQKGGTITYTDNEGNTQQIGTELNSFDADISVLDKWNNFLNETYKDTPIQSNSEDINVETLTLEEGEFQLQRAEDGKMVIVFGDDFSNTIYPFYLDKLKQVCSLIFEIMNKFVNFGEDYIHTSKRETWNAQYGLYKSYFSTIDFPDKFSVPLIDLLDHERRIATLTQAQLDQIKLFAYSIKLMNLFNLKIVNELVNLALDSYLTHNSFDNFDPGEINIGNIFQNVITNSDLDDDAKDLIGMPNGYTIRKFEDFANINQQFGDTVINLLKTCAIKIAAFCLLLTGSSINDSKDFTSFLLSSPSDYEGSFPGITSFTSQHKLLCAELGLDGFDTVEADPETKNLAKLVTDGFTENRPDASLEDAATVLPETPETPETPEDKTYTMYSWHSVEPKKVILSKLNVKLTVNEDTITAFEIIEEPEIVGGVGLSVKEAIDNIKLVENEFNIVKMKFSEELQNKALSSVGVSEENKYFVGYVNNEENANIINTLVESSLAPVDVTMTGGQKGGSLSEKLNAFVQNIISNTSDNSKVNTPINTAAIDQAKQNAEANLNDLSKNIDTTEAHVDELCSHNSSIKQKHNENVAKHNQMKLATKTGGSRKRRRRKRKGLKNKSMKR